MSGIEIYRSTLEHNEQLARRLVEERSDGASKPGGAKPSN